MYVLVNSALTEERNRTATRPLIVLSSNISSGLQDQKKYKIFFWNKMMISGAVDEKEYTKSMIMMKRKK